MRRSTFSAKSIARLAVIVFLVLILISQLWIYTPGLARRPSVSIQLEALDGRIFSNATIQTPFAADFRQTVYLVRDFPKVATVYFYYDSTYPLSYSNAIDWYGLSQHLEIASGFRGVPLNVVVVNAAQLPGILLSPPTAGEVLVLASGVLPDTVFTKTLNLVTPWVESGGILVWIGDKIGTYSGVPGVSLKFPSAVNPGSNGTAQFLNVTLLNGTSQFYNASSPLATAFNIDYTPGIRFDDLNVTRLEAFNGTVLGNLDKGFTNIASVPLGRGLILYFGGPTQDATSLGTILVNLFETGAFTGEVEPINVTSWSMAPGASVKLSLDLVVPSYSFGSGPVLACSFVTQTDLLALFGETSCVNLT